MIPPRAARSVAALLAGVLAACTTLPPAATQAPLDTADAPFTIDGRISARRGDAGVAGHFSWTHEAGHDAIDLATPLGQTLARLAGDAREVRVQLHDGRVESAATWSALTGEAFGVAIPVEGLASWVRGAPRAGTRYSVERDRAGRVAVLRQDGWEVVYAYVDDAARKPLRLTLSYPGADPIEVRVVVDNWGG